MTPEERTRTPDLREIQRWFQAVITHPDGVVAGATSEAGPSGATPARVADLITASSTLDAESRLSVYANAYFGRLVECLGDVYPVVRRTVGDEVFEELAMDYLQAHPSRRYTLNVLGQAFPGFLAVHRPPREPEGGLDWADFILDIARFEWALFEVFDGPGPEELPAPELSSPDVGLDGFAECRFELVPGFQLFRASFAVSEHFNRAREAPPDEEFELPEPRPCLLALVRRDYVVRRHPLSAQEITALGLLRDGGTVAEAIEAAFAMEAVEPETVQAWFARWAREGFFQSVRSQ